MSDIFISYASQDRPKAKELADILIQQGWSVWWDRVIPIGRSWDEVIEEKLDVARCVVVLWSGGAVRSDWVKAEAREGMRRRILLPVLLEDVKIPIEFRHIQAADLTNWSGEAGDGDLDLLLEAVTAQVRSPLRTEAAFADARRAIPPQEALLHTQVYGSKESPSGHFLNSSAEAIKATSPTLLQRDILRLINHLDTGIMFEGIKGREDILSYLVHLWKGKRVYKSSFSLHGASTSRIIDVAFQTRSFNCHFGEFQDETTCYNLFYGMIDQLKSILPGEWSYWGADVLDKSRLDYFGARRSIIEYPIAEMNLNVLRNRYSKYVIDFSLEGWWYKFGL